MMKKIFFVAAVAAALVACNQNTPDDPQSGSTAFDQAKYFEALGTNTVPNVEGEGKDQPFVLDSVRVEAKMVTDSTLDLYLYGIRFASKMPVSIDMVIPAAKYTRTANRITLSGEDIIPTMGGNPFDRYVITGLKGYVTADSLVFSNNYGTYNDCSYAGKITQME